MNKIIARTILTFDISDKDAYKDITDILEDLGYQDGKDQSTRVHPKSLRILTLSRINSYCKENLHNLTEDDRICFATPETLKVENDIVPIIVHREYYYNLDKDAFI